MTRNEDREILMQILYEMDASKEMNDAAIESLTAERLAGNHIQRGRDLLANILAHLTEIDDVINAHSTKWKTSRMPKVDLAIMRLAVGEMRYAEDVSDAVAITQAINLGKKFSTEHSSKFIHGVLGAIAKDA